MPLLLRPMSPLAEERSGRLFLVDRVDPRTYAELFEQAPVTLRGRGA